MRRSLPLSRLAAVLVFGAAFAAPIRGGAETPAQDQVSAQPLRFCADPDNLPFSSSKAATPGLYIELGQKIADTLGRPFEPVWFTSEFGAYTVRSTLLSRHCDVYVGLPSKGFMGPTLIRSKPFMHIGYAMMAPADAHIARLDDLAGKHVAVQYSSPPQTLLAEHDDITMSTFLDPDEAARALGRHEVDAAFIWGPSAGYVNVTALNHAYQVTPIAGDGMQYPVTIGFQKKDFQLRDQVDTVLDAKRPLIAELQAKYGLPSTEPVQLASLDDDTSPMMVLASSSETIVVADASTPAADAGASTAWPWKAETDADSIAAGKELFNGTCSHCHGPDAVQSVKKIDLRLLHHRYADDTLEVFHTTVTHGRPAKGMPNWSGVFSEDDFKKIFSYLNSIQTPD